MTVTELAHARCSGDSSAPQIVKCTHDSLFSPDLQQRLVEGRGLFHKHNHDHSSILALFRFSSEGADLPSQIASSTSPEGAESIDAVNVVFGEMPNVLSLGLQRHDDGLEIAILVHLSIFSRG